MYTNFHILYKNSHLKSKLLEIQLAPIKVSFYSLFLSYHSTSCIYADKNVLTFIVWNFFLIHLNAVLKQKYYTTIKALEIQLSLNYLYIFADTAYFRNSINHQF